ncbi:helix-hairpin-helix domain-containing protein [Allochromatium tepidum]|uniref:helix-hairpin-helix domain-containing protein n=1 Tax=Allochromatium tepidum TaxID=553982 RepID=UPI001BCF0882|nr:helix-hairpin-helix domain-containing protein [Allochromatium tepidum]
MNLRAAIEQLDKFCQERGWNGRELKTGINYRVGGKTAVSIYSSGTDKPGTIEVAFEVDTISKIANVSTSTVNAWIRQLQENIGSYARPKTQYQYPRVALASNQQLQEFW